jgi:acid phosphatase type 7
MAMKRNNLLTGAFITAIALAAGAAMAWELLKPFGSGPEQPKSIVTTLNGDARTSRAFTWYTESPDSETVLELTEGTGSKAFGGDGVRRITGTTAVIRTGEEETQGAHKVTVTGLAPGTDYSYRVGSGEDGSWSEPEDFRTEEEDVGTFTFLNVTDSQGETEEDFELWGRTLDRAFAQYPETRLVLHNGDLTEDPEDEKAWDAFFDKPQKWLRRIPLMPVTGNHDEVDGKAERFTSHFNLPDNGNKSSLPGTTYSFDYGPVHFVVLNTESNIKEQTEWLRRDLAASKQPWTIVAMHRGVYGGNEYKKVQDWVPILDEFKVDLVLQGHNHEYSRSYPLRYGVLTGTDGNQVVNREGTVYVVMNTSGPKFNETKDDQFYHAVHLQNEKQMFAGITVNGNTLTFRAYDTEGRKMDEFMIRH